MENRSSLTRYRSLFSPVLPGSPSVLGLMWSGCCVNGGERVSARFCFQPLLLLHSTAPHGLYTPLDHETFDGHSRPGHGWIDFTVSSELGSGLSGCLSSEQPRIINAEQHLTHFSSDRCRHVHTLWCPGVQRAFSQNQPSRLRPSTTEETESCVQGRHSSWTEFIFSCFCFSLSYKSSCYSGRAAALRKALE